MASSTSVSHTHTHLESDGQRLVTPPVCRQHGAQKVGTVRLHKLTWMIGDHLEMKINARRYLPERDCKLEVLEFGIKRASAAAYLHHPAVGHPQLAYQSGPSSGLLSTQRQRLGHLSPGGEGGGGRGVTPARGWV